MIMFHWLVQLLIHFLMGLSKLSKLIKHLYHSISIIDASRYSWTSLSFCQWHPPGVVWTCACCATSQTNSQSGPVQDSHKHYGSRRMPSGQLQKMSNQFQSAFSRIPAIYHFLSSSAMARDCSMGHSSTDGSAARVHLVLLARAPPNAAWPTWVLQCTC